MKTLNTTTLLRTSTASAVLGLALIASPAFAQESPSTSPDIERDAQDVQIAPGTDVEDSVIREGGGVVITGSLIRNPNIESSSPVAVIGETEIQLRQASTAEELLRDLPGISPSIGSQVNNGNGGASYVNLRNLGSNRNVVLLDNRRIVPADLVGRTDLDNIPTALVERVDRLTGGASTTYGADAVAGVVNFVTKRDFAGADISVQQGITQRGDGNLFRADVTLGANFDDGRGNAAFSVGYLERDSVFQGDRSFSAVQLSSTTGLPGGSGTSVPARITIPGVGTRQLTPDGTAFRPTAAFDAFNFAPFNLFQLPLERFSLFGQANYEVSDGIELYTNGLFSQKTTSTIIAPAGSFGSNLQFSIANPFLAPAVAQTLFNSIPAAQRGAITFAQARAAGAGTANELLVNPVVTRRFVEGGPRINDYTTRLFNITTGIRGDITPNIGFDLYGSYGESENRSRQTNNGLNSRLQQSVDAVRDPATGAIVCRDPSNGCVPLNIFGPAGSLNQDGFDFINVSAGGATNATLAQARGLISGDLDFLSLRSPLADEAFGFAIGSEYRKYTAGTTSDLATQTPNEVLGNGAANPDSFGSYDVVEGFVELIAPLVVDRPFFHSLQLELGGRVSDYSTTGTSYTYKAAGSWEPVPSLKIRGGYNRATRSPNIGELFAPTATGLDSLDNDPCQGAAPLTNANLRAVCLAQGAPVGSIGIIDPPSAGQINVTSGGNLNLDVEKADTYTAGVVFQPVFAPGLSVSVDYYNIKIKDAITSPTSGDILQACFGPQPYLTPGAGAAATAACTSIRRNPATGGLDGNVATTPGLPLVLSNLGLIKTDGIDLIASYRRDLGFAGLNLSFIGNWTNRSQFQATPTSQNFNGDIGPRECLGQYSVNCDAPLPEFTFQQRTTLEFGGTALSLLWRFVDDLNVEGGLDAGFLPAFSSIDEKHYFDLSVRQDVTDDINFVLTASNLFDNDPPVVGSTIGTTTFNGGNTYPSTYDPLGRRFSFGANIKF